MGSSRWPFAQWRGTQCTQCTQLQTHAHIDRCECLAADFVVLYLFECSWTFLCHLIIGVTLVPVHPYVIMFVHMVSWMEYCVVVSSISYACATGPFR